MTSGEPGVGRTCLKPYEIDPTGQAQVCADPCDPTRIKDGGECITPTPTPVTASVSPQLVPQSTIPQVGAGTGMLVLAFVFGVFVAYFVYLNDRRK